MGHDLHFLERLERFDLGQAERALALYRDPELVKTLLAELALPPGADRIAIALEPTEPSPHVIVSRDGHFVTCLAAGMSLGSAFRVSRATVDGVRARHERLRTALDAADSGQLRRVFKRLADDPEYFTREDALLVKAIHPLLGAELATFAVQVFDGHHTLAAKLSTRPPPELRRQFLKMLWTLQWVLSALSAGAMAQGVPPELLTTEKLAGDSLKLWIGQAALGLVLRSTGARALWAVARLAREALPELKRLRAAAADANHIALANLSLGLVALRHPKYRAEISKVLHTAPAATDPGRREAVERIDRLTREPIVRMLADPEQAQASSHAFLEAWRAKHHPELAVEPGTIYFNTYSVKRHAALVWPYEALKALPWLASAGFEDLFAPRGSFVPEPPTADALDFVAETAASMVVGSRQPVRAEPQVGRNAPCPCGSGKKAKKCCAA